MVLDSRVPWTDLTPVFRAIAKVKEAKSGKLNGQATNQRPSSSPTFGFTARKLSDVAADLVGLVQLVLTRRGDYLSFNAPHPLMTESQRDRFDADSDAALRHIKAELAGVEKRLQGAEAGPLTEEEMGHLQAVSVGIGRRLKDLADIVAKMRSLRLAHTARRSQFLRLSNLVEAAKRRERANASSASGGLSPASSSATLLSFDRAGGTLPELRRRNGRESPAESWPGWEGVRDDVAEDTVYESAQRKERELRARAEEGREDTARELQRRAAMEEEERQRMQESSPSDGTDSAATAQLMEENKRMLERLTRVNHTMDSIEGQVAEIQRLQETFSDKLMEQEADIELLSEQAQHASENLQQGNEWIREAISNSASRRVIVLFCILVLTFSVLFVDWYNP